MVLWEMTLATAYFLGLKRTYAITLRIQRRASPPRPSSPRAPSIPSQEDQWSFDVVVKSRSRHATQGGVQGIPVSGGFDQMKPSSQINVHSGKPPRSIDISKQCSAASNSDQVKRYRSFFTPWNIPMRTFPTAVSHDAASL